ncbi:MAG: tyrosine--tRNA ligase [Candidatus Nealsonbacteria bacterium]|nr:MAG: tyrosine--tRNA ligase [Candidatus Nealsonbacteria bacterium]
MKGKTQKQKIDELLNRGVEQVLPSREGLAGLMGRKKIRLYLGIDPTAKKLHLGHVVNLRKLQKFAELGHQAILVIGTGTVLAGDPSLREAARPRISEKEIKENIKDWKNQLKEVLDFSKVRIRYNGDWLLKLRYQDIIGIASHISAGKLFQREMFQRRLKKGDTVWTHEALYPLFQGYDTVALGVDLEIGGTDQIFNMLIGRELMQKMKRKEKFVLTTRMILGTDGKPMSKTKGNCVWLTDSAQEMYGKIMSIPDRLILSYFELLTDVPIKEIRNLSFRQSKAKLAREITCIFHGKKAADLAEKEFNRVFKEKKLPSKMPEAKVKERLLNILDLLVKTKLTSSKAEAKRLVEQGGIGIDGEIQKDWRKKIEIKKGMVIRAGRRRFVKIQ